MLSSHLRLCLSNGLFSSGYATRNLSWSLLYPPRFSFPAHLVLLRLIWVTKLTRRWPADKEGVRECTERGTGWSFSLGIGEGLRNLHSIQGWAKVGLHFFNLIFVVPCIMLYSGEISPTRCNNCFFFAMALLYMFRVTISPIIRSTMLCMATGELAHLGCY